MKAIFRKLIHEFWLSKTKFVLCVTATAIAAWGVATVTFTYLMSERDFRNNYDHSEPADFSLRIGNFNSRIKKVINDFNVIAESERRELLVGQIRDRRGVWMTVLLFGIEDMENQKLDIVTPKEWDKGLSNFLLVEQNATTFLDNSPRVSLRFGAQHLSLELPKGGIAHDALQAPAQMEQMVYGYTSISSIDSLLEQNKVRYLFRVNDTHKNITSIKKSAEALISLIKKNGGSVSGLDVREPGKHVHQPIIDGVSFLQASFGLVLLIVGITLFSLILLTWLMPQFVQVGIMKAIGASSRQIYSSYTLILLLIILTGILIGLPLGVQSAKLFNRFIAFVQNFEVVDGSFPFAYYAVVILASSCLPLAFGLRPIRKISNISVREALSTTFHSKQVKIIRFLVNLKIKASLKYGISNVFRSGYKTYLLLALLSLGICLFFTGSNLSHSFNKDFSTYFDGTPYQITINLPEPISSDLSILDNIKVVKSYVSLSFENVSYQYEGKTETALLRIYPPNYSIKDEMFLQGLENKNCFDCLFIHPAMLEDEFSKIKPGAMIEILTNDSTSNSYKYVGLMKEAIPSRGGMVSIFSKSPLKTYNKISIELNDGVEIVDGMITIEKVLKAKGLTYTSISDKDSSLNNVINHFKPTYLIVQGMGIFTIILSLAGILIVINLTFQERTTEIGILKAVGGGSKSIASLFSVEFLLVTFLAIIFAFGVSAWLSSFLCDVYGVMIRGQKIQSVLDNKVLVVSAFTILLIQWFVVITYTKNKIQKTSNELLTSLN